MSKRLLMPSDNSTHFQCRSLLVAETSLFNYMDTDILLQMSQERIKTSVLGASA